MWVAKCSEFKSGSEIYHFFLSATKLNQMPVELTQFAVILYLLKKKWLAQLTLTQQYPLLPPLSLLFSLVRKLTAASIASKHMHYNGHFYFFSQKAELDDIAENTRANEMVTTTMHCCEQRTSQFPFCEGVHKELPNSSYSHCMSGKSADDLLYNSPISSAEEPCFSVRKLQYVSLIPVWY